MSLTLNPYLMLLVFVVFIALIFFLNILLYRPILAFMQKRDESLNGGILALDGDKKRMEEIDLEIQKILKDAKEEAREIRNLATQEAQKKYNESFERARVELENRFNESKKGLVSQQEALHHALKNEAQCFGSLIEDKIAQMRSVQ